MGLTPPPTFSSGADSLHFCIMNPAATYFRRASSCSFAHVLYSSAYLYRYLTDRNHTWQSYNFDLRCESGSTWERIENRQLCYSSKNTFVNWDMIMYVSKIDRELSFLKDDLVETVIK